jgi:P27 family predicted phage terminase small subunit
MAGRKKIPRELKQMKGTLQKCRDDGLLSNGEVLIEIPLPPSWLPKQAQQIYSDTCADLVSLKLLTKTNLRLIISYSNFLAKHLQIEEMLSGKGLMSNIVTYTDDNGNLKKIQVNALAKVSLDSFTQAMKIATEFGLTPSSKGRVPRIHKEEASIANYFNQLEIFPNEEI